MASHPGQGRVGLYLLAPLCARWCSDRRGRVARRHQPGQGHPQHSLRRPTHRRSTDPHVGSGADRRRADVVGRHLVPAHRSRRLSAPRAGPRHLPRARRPGCLLPRLSDARPGRRQGACRVATRPPRWSPTSSSAPSPSGSSGCSPDDCTASTSQPRRWCSCAVFPGSFVLSFAYTEALLLVLAMACLWCLPTHRWVGAGVLAAFGTATRPNGLALVLACAVASVDRHPQRARLEIARRADPRADRASSPSSPGSATTPARPASGSAYRPKRGVRARAYGLTAVRKTFEAFASPLTSPDQHHHRSLRDDDGLDALLLASQAGCRLRWSRTSWGFSR